MIAVAVLKRGWFLAIPLAWFALGWASSGPMAATQIALVSFVAGALAFLRIERTRFRGAGVLAALMALVGPVGYDLARNPYFFFERPPSPPPPPSETKEAKEPKEKEIRLR
ncbi:MAG: hypothetical protein HC870_00355, partial [Rhizobiales bacterium]|nr:hypothetical protein [Hyphomicrobiales bacterium]